MILFLSSKQYRCCSACSTSDHTACPVMKDWKREDSFRQGLTCASSGSAQRPSQRPFLPLHSLIGYQRGLSHNAAGSDQRKRFLSKTQWSSSSLWSFLYSVSFQESQSQLLSYSGCMAAFAESVPMNRWRWVKSNFLRTLRGLSLGAIGAWIAISGCDSNDGWLAVQILCTTYLWLGHYLAYQAEGSSARRSE